VAEDGGERIEDVRTRLGELADELADLAIEQLRLAVEQQADTGGHASAGGRSRSHGPAAEERRLTRARRAVERAAAILSSPPEGAGDDS
jgi:hypothetical protein